MAGQGAYAPNAKYESDSGVIYPIRVQPETLAAVFGTATNISPTGAATGEASAKVSGSRRQNGVMTRTVTLAFTGAVDGYAPNAKLRVPVMTPAAFQQIKKGDTGTYGTNAVRVVGKSPERVN